MDQLKHPKNIKSIMDDAQGKRIFFWIIAAFIIGFGLLALF